LVDDDPAVEAPHDGDQALGLEDAQRLAQRRPGHGEPLDEVGLLAEPLAVGQLPADDQRPQLVRDELRLLAGRRRALVGRHGTTLPLRRPVPR
jgi:hypothetical protein